MAKKKVAPKVEPVKDGPKCWMCGVQGELSPVTIMAAQRQEVSVCPRCRRSIESGDSDYLIAK